MPQTTQEMRDERALIEGAINLYCDWLNGFGYSGYYEFTTSNFKGEHGELRIVTRYKVDGWDVYVLEVGTDDELDPATVTLYFGGTGKLVHATQNFDGGMSLWYEDYKPV